MIFLPELRNNKSSLKRKQENVVQTIARVDYEIYWLVD